MASGERVSVTNMLISNSDASAMLKLRLGRLPKVVVNTMRKFGHVVAVKEVAVSKWVRNGE
jgi:hypothetical protein